MSKFCLTTKIPKLDYLRSFFFERLRQLKHNSFVEQFDSPQAIELARMDFLDLSMMNFRDTATADFCHANRYWIVLFMIISIVGGKQFLKKYLVVSRLSEDYLQSNFFRLD
jgi:hypothetical protein